MLISEARSRLSVSTQEAVQDLRSAVADARAMVLFLANTPPVHELVSESGAAGDQARIDRAKDQLATIFDALIGNFPDLMQVRFIEAANNGREVVRVDHRSLGIFRIPEAELQEKGDRDYVSESLANLPGVTQMFGIDLNREHGKIEVPYVPVLRITTPVWGQGDRAAGVVVINVDMRRVFGRLASGAPEHANFYLADADGNFLIHPDPAKAFGFEFGHPYRLGEEFPELNKLMALKKTDDTGVRYPGMIAGQIANLARVPINAMEDAQTYTIAFTMPEAVILQHGSISREAIIVITILLAIFGVLVAILTSRRFVRSLRKLTKAAQDFSDRKSPDMDGLAVEGQGEVSVLARTFKGMIATLKERQETLEEKEERIRAILEAVCNPIITINEEGVIQSANAATSKLLGYERDELIGSNVSMLMNPHDASRHDGYLAKYRKDRQAAIIGVGREVEARHKDGTPICIHLSVSKVRLKDRPLFTGVMTDLTDLKKVERLKNEFISTVNHELRTPMTSIKGGLALLKSSVLGELSGEASSVVGIAESNCDRLVRLINDILDIEKMEAGNPSLRLDRLDLNGFLQDMVEANAGHADAAGVNLTLGDVPQDAPFTADPDRMAQVVTNLVSNGIKFTPGGGTVTLSASVTDECVRISVADQGPGIPEEFHAKIFGKFAQADSSSTRASGGTGLGLAISKAIVDAHGGRIWFETSEETGTVFHIDMPFAQSGTAFPEESRNVA